MFGAVRYKLRNDAIKKPFPRFKKHSLLPIAAQINAQIKKEELSKYKSPSECKRKHYLYVTISLPRAVFHQTVLRHPVIEILKMLEKQRETVVKLSKRYKFKLPKFDSKARTANLKYERSYVLHKGSYILRTDR